MPLLFGFLDRGLSIAYSYLLAFRTYGLNPLPPASLKIPKTP
ncbi:hypothetical protein CAPGI0001_1256 [Capnocytophaga gingivalis ATCC 33624]|nr:hypothetical protein CAPGI0001_1256 [Capnocytophaga gingivalis ATCC 33624]